MEPTNHSSDSKNQKQPTVNKGREAQLRPHGFEAGEPIYEFTSAFRIRDALLAMVESTYSNPEPVYLKSEDDDVFFPVVVTMVKACFQPFAPYLTTPAGCHNTPDWYFEGWVLKSGYDTFTGITRIRAYLVDDVNDPDASTEVLWQVIPTDPDPNAPLWVI